MGDVAEILITPETPGRSTILNPFESPTDYHRLHESLVPSPSVFKCSRASSATPAKFKWSIDEMANLLPVHIDPEDIHRQTLYLSQNRTDSEIEHKRQKAIDQFFTKSSIVPSPWGPPASQQSIQLNCKKSSSPLVIEEHQPAKKINATCQTVLSLPVNFDIEKVLGDYCRTEEVSEQVQETLSSSSLRRKLFLDGNASGSESSSPSSPERDGNGSSREMMSSVIVSPLNCGTTATTPSSGQFSSSPIQGRGRAYSLGSVTSPMFPERSSPVFKSPTVSPIVHLTPISGERKRLSFLSPDGPPSCSQNRPVNRCAESPYVEGCSPIRSCSPLHRLHSSQVSSVLHPHLPDTEDLYLCKSLPTMELDFSPAACKKTAHKEGSRSSHTESPASPHECERMEHSKSQEEELRGRFGKVQEEEEEEEEVVASGEEFCQLSSFRMGSVSNAESTRMFMSLLAEGSIVPYDVSMQVDSGYNTYSTCTASIMDTVGADSQSKESQDTHTAEDGLSSVKHTKSK